MRRATPTGFTLLELILALAIFVGSAAVLSRLIFLGTESAEFTQWQAVAQMIVESRISELEAGILLPTAIGTYPEETDSQWQWTLATESVGDTLNRVTVTADRLDSAGKSVFSFSLHRLFYSPLTETTSTETTDESS